jgi:quinohemoprotein ethanol dehydrogenase
VLIMGGPAFGTKPAKGNLLAWNPVTQKPAWKLPRPTFLNGGVLATGGKLVFQGTVDGLFKAYQAESGKELWSFDAKAPILAAPITYRAHGKQYVTLLTGLSMGMPMYAPTMVGPETIESLNLDSMSQQRRVLTFAVGGKATLPPRRQPSPPPPDPEYRPDPSRKQAGFMPYQMHCLSCHGDQAIGLGQGPDLRRSPVPQDAATFDKIVRGGMLEARGMPKFAEFPDEKLEAIRYYIRARAAELRTGRRDGTVGIPAFGGGGAKSARIGP